MKNLAKLLSLILALALVFALVGCEKSNDDDDDDSKPSKSTSDKKDKDGDKNVSEEVKIEVNDEPATSKDEPSSKEDDDDSIVGDWEGAFYVTSEESGETYAIGIELSFYNDGEYSMQMSAEDYMDMMIEEIEIACDENDVDFDEYLAEQGYDSVDDFREEGIDEMSSELAEDGEYSFDGDEFVLDDEEIDFEFDGDEFAFEIEGGIVELERA